MKKSLFALSALVLGLASPAFAHLEMGFYDGLGGSQACSFEVVGVTFDGVRSPLNERVQVRFEGKEWVLSHPPVISLDTQVLGFDDAHLQTARGVRGGGEAVVLTMSHEEGHEGPLDISFLQTLTVNGVKTVELKQCAGLKHRD